jgi:glycosyltransferase involved in cell wall biosynthesis
MDYPKISIITVSYNSEKYIEDAILSVINQNYINKEYIIIDGGSTDDTLSIIKKYRHKIDYFISEPDNGISDAFNKGIRAATGGLIGFLNSDDFMMDNVLTQIAECYEPEIEIYRGFCIMLDQKKLTKKCRYPNEKFKIIPFFAKVCHESSFISKDVYYKYGDYKVDLKYTMDLDFFIRIYSNGVKSKIVNICVITFRLGGVSSSHAKFIENERKKIILENGGNILQAYIYVIFHRLRFSLKKYINKLILLIGKK